MSEPDTSNAGNAIAIIGMSGRWPHARNVAEFWRNVRDGVDCISRFTTEELEVAGAAELAAQPDYVKARSVLEKADEFDAAFFGILPKEAELMDPQQRVLLECCWEALEDGGYDPQTYQGAIGVYAGASPNSYFLQNVCTNREYIQDYVGSYPLGNYQAMLGAIADTLATRVSYKLNLRGPSLTIQTACSTSLVAICHACQSLLNYQSDMVLAGGVAITFPQKRGYHYEEGGMGSADGRCRPFDAEARGTVFGSGAGVVLLKRLDEAIEDGDPIYAVIKGFAVNNDGSGKVGFTAPSLEGQANVIAMAQGMADVDPESITYLEAHGTATPLGDPIEFAALTRAFRARTNAKSFCALGTAKANVGHLEAASGVTGVINAVCALVHQQLPPTFGFDKPNPKLDFANSPFYVNTRLAPWKRRDGPRRAGVSSFGVGGTNAHLVLEEAPPAVQPNLPRFSHLIILSARSAAALDVATVNLAGHLKSHTDADLDAVTHTLQTGRRAFDHRRSVACTDVADAISVLESRDRKRVHSHEHKGQPPSAVFMFPGQGSQHLGMGGELYRTVASFRDDVDTCAAILKPHLQLDLREVLYGDGGEAAVLKQTALAQPSLFVIEYALAKLWMRWGVQPTAMIGHSVGEFVAACLAGVFSLEDALAIIATRGRMMQDLPPGAMLSVRMGEEEIVPLLNGALSIAAKNGPSLNVVAGPAAALDALERTISERGIPARRLETSHAFHSRMMDPILIPFEEYLRKFHFEAPKLPYISGVSGTWITAKEATDPKYWARHFREPVHFSQGFQLLHEQVDRLFLEVGPGRVLCTLARQHRNGSAEPNTIASLPATTDPGSDLLSMHTAAGVLWEHGAALNWAELHAPGVRRCSLPTYPFERQRYWIEPTAPSARLEPSSDQDVNPVEVPPRESQSPMTTSVPAAIAAPAASRETRLRAALVDILQDLSGLNLSECDPSATFLEMGFDSLFLTQTAQAVHAKFGMRIVFRQLLDRESSLNALAAYLDAKLPAEAFPAEVVPAPQEIAAPAAVAELRNNVLEDSPSFAPAVAGQSAIEGIIRDQLQAMSQLMAKQLEMVRGGSPTTIAAPIVAPAKSAIAKQPAAAAEPAKPASAQEFKAFGPYKPPQRGPVGGLTEQQSQYLESFIRRYVAKTGKSKESTQSRRKILADPRVAAGFRAQWKEMVYPLVTVRSKGSKIWDLDGNEYIDILNGFGPIFFGHAPDFVTEALAAQLKNGFEIGPQTPLAGEVAELVCELTGNERATFCNTGSEAVMAAMRLARTVTARNKVVLFAGAYHGMFDEVLLKGTRRNGVPHSQPIAPGIPNESVSNMIVLDYGTPESLEYIRQHASELAAVIVEPVQSRRPGFVPIEFLKEIRKITEQSETAFIFDEVVTGFRVHPGGAQALFGIRADLATYGKVVGGGMPIGILAGKAKFMDALDGGMWQYGDDSFPETGVTFFAGTFVRHPLALAAVRAILQQLKKAGPELQRSLAEKTTNMGQTLNNYFKERGVPLEIANFASWFYFSFNDQPHGSLLYYHMREKGIHIQEGFPCFMTSAHSDADIAHIIRAFKESIAELQANGFLIAPGHQHDSAIAQPAAKAIAVELPKELPLTESQMEIWLSARLSDEANCAYNESFTLKLCGALNGPALQKSLDVLVNRHDALRCTFDPQKNCIRVLDNISVTMPTIDLSVKKPGERSAALQDILHSAASEPFDLAHGPLVRAKLIKLDAEQHTLLFTSHHIVCDGWSTNVLLGELGQLYGAETNGSTANLPAPTPFREYAQSQAKWRQTPEHEAVESWWAKQFADPVTPLELPTDRPRGSVKSFPGNTVRRIIGASAYQRIKRFGAQNGCTMFATVLTGFATLLHRLTNQADIVVGIPSAGQSLVETDSLVGHCVNFLPVRSSFENDPSVAGVLTHMRGALLDAYDHQNYTYGSLIQKLGLRRDPSRLPLVEVQFNLERVGTGLTFPGLQVQVDPCPKSFVNFGLFLNVVESDDGLVIDCDYNTDLFDAQTIDRWLHHLEVLLEGFVANPRQAVSAVPMLGDSERRQLVVEWNNTRADYPREKCVHQLIGEQAARTPQAIAAVCEGKQLTYAQLETASNQLANFLRKRGVGTGDRIAICLDRSLEMLIGVVGILKAGAAYVPLDPEFPAERIAAVFEDARPTILLTHSAISPRLTIGSTQVVCVDKAWSEIVREKQTAPDTATTCTDLAYVIFTSGSTGKPKGVEIPHRAVVNMLCSMAKQPGLTADDTLLAVTTLAFDIAVLELYLPLSLGAKVVIATREETADGNKLLALMTATNTTVMQATPTTWRLLIEAGWTEQSNLKILCGGEALSRDLADALLTRSSNVWNMYGPTETTVWSAVSLVEAGSGPVTIGPPIANTEFYVLDKKNQPVPLGVAGELHIGGEGLARGYWNRQDLTTEKFIPDPFRGQAEWRLYKTGDLVRYRQDRTLEFLGRMDTQVKVRGFRIETAEVEHVLKQYPGLRESVVVAREDSPGDKRLVAYLVAAQPVPAPGDLRRFMAAKLPGYMVPSVFVPLEALPRTPNGKIDRRALPAPSATGITRSQDVVAPRNSREQTIADVCADVLKVTGFGVHDSLFDLGVDSLQIFQIVARANDAGLKVTPTQILTCRTIAAICEELDRVGQSTPRTEAPRLTAVARDRYRVKRSQLEVPEGAKE